MVHYLSSGVLYMYVNPLSVDPVSVDPLSVDPLSVDPVSVDPVSVEKSTLFFRNRPKWSNKLFMDNGNQLTVNAI